MPNDNDLIHITNIHQSNKLMDDYDLNDESADVDFDSILKLACYLSKCSASFISFINGDLQNIRFTLNTKRQKVALNSSVCKFVVQERNFVKINDLTQDVRTKHWFQDREINLKFYAGIPLINAKDRLLGTLCVSNETAVPFDDLQIEAFKTLGNQVINAFYLRKRDLEKIKIRRREDEFNILFNSSSDLICILNDKAEITIINNSVKEILGYTESECLGINISKFVFPDDQNIAYRLAIDSLKSRTKRFEVETRVQTKNGGIKWVSWNAVTKNRSWFIIGREITKYKETLRNLNQLSIVASKTNNGVIISNADSKAAWVNNAFTKITGFDLFDLKDRKWGDVLIGNGGDKSIIEKARTETRNKNSFSIELLAYRKDGLPIWLSVHNTIILDKNGEIENLVEIVIDISQRKQAEERLELLSLVASKTENGVSICDKNGNVKWINEALFKILGYSIKELEDRRIMDILVCPDENSKLSEIRAQEIESAPYNIEINVCKKDGSEVWISISNTPIYDEQGCIDKQIEIITDITERKEAEFQLIAAKEQALQLSKAKEMFLSVMSHEIRTPLNAVIGLSNILFEDEKLESQNQTINLLKFSADNLMSLINDILDFSKIEMGKMELENKRLNIKELIVDIVESLKFKTIDKEIAINYKVSEQVPVLVRGDKTRLYQILINLINNAIKFTEEGFVNIFVDVVQFKEESIVLNFKIVDSGIGIAEDKLEAVFESFTQAASNTARKYGGSGLGLSITKKLIELYKGSIKVSSQLGKGSTFEFEIEFNNFKEMEPEIKNELPQSNFKVLVVDDNEINIMLASKVLSKYGFEVVTTNNGADAIELLASKSFDIVLMDVHMPDMDGYEATKVIRNMEDTYFKNIPIIALTASILVEDVEEIQKNGMNDYQLKPFKPDELVAKINKYVIK